MNSLPTKPIIKIYRIPAPRGALEAYGVRSRRIKNGTTLYTVIVWPDKIDGHKTIRLTCDCLAGQNKNWCRHRTAIIKERMPTASVWKTENDAKRQHRKRWAIAYGPHDKASNRIHSGVVWATERYASKRVRRTIK